MRGQAHVSGARDRGPGWAWEAWKAWKAWNGWNGWCHGAENSGMRSPCLRGGGRITSTAPCCIAAFPDNNGEPVFSLSLWLAGRAKRSTIGAFADIGNASPEINAEPF